jgi:F0F1-type ATP synthase membrane subunit b/b'
VDAARDDLNQRLEAARTQMLGIAEAAATETHRHQEEVRTRLERRLVAD